VTGGAADELATRDDSSEAGGARPGGAEAAGPVDVSDLAARPAALVLPQLEVGPIQRFDVEVEGGRLAAASVGAPAAPAWVIAHGVGSSARFVAQAFAGPVLAAGRRLVVYDLRGHGASSLARSVAEHHLDVHATDLLAVVAAVGAGVEVVGGVSLGGHAAVRAVVRGRLVVPAAPAAPAAPATPATPATTAAPARSAAPVGPARPAAPAASAFVGLPAVERDPQAAWGPQLRAVLACLPAWTGPSVVGAGPHAAVAAQVRRIGIAAIIGQLRHDTALAGWLRTTLVTDYARHDPASLAAALLALDGGDAPGEEELAALPVPLALVAWPDDPGHPLAVAERWRALAGRSALRAITIDELEAGVERLGRQAVAAVEAATSDPPATSSGSA
jgi:pimeloyl-ACP methyl ester carboxylesterase